MKSSTFKKIAATALCAFAIVSCYKIGEINMPSEVAPNSTFTGTIKLVDDDSANENDVETTGAFGVLVPNGWTVTLPDNAFEQYNVTDGSITAYGATYNEIYTAILNDYYTREGYTWFGFYANAKNKLLMGDNYIMINFAITTNGEVGDYELEFVVGDEEENLEKYLPLEEHNAAGADGSIRNCRLRETATIDDEDFDEKVLDLNTTIKVTGEAGINEINADNYSVNAIGNGQISIELNDASLANTIANVYDVNGRLIASRVLGAENVIDAAQGLCVVTLINGNKTATQKVVVK